MVFIRQTFNKICYFSKIVVTYLKKRTWGPLLEPNIEVGVQGRHHNITIHILTYEECKSVHGLSLGAEYDRNGMFLIPLLSNASQPQPLDQFYQIWYKGQPVRKYVSVSGTDFLLRIYSLILKLGSYYL